MAKKQPLPYYSIKIKKRLIELNMTQRDLAKAVGMNENYLTDVLNGRRSGKKYIDLIMEELEIKEKAFKPLKGVI